jgi:PAS domain S-box-containing protein
MIANGGFQWLKGISIAKKLYFVVGTMAVLIALELATLWFSMHALSSVRAIVGAEGLWSKAEKEAVYHLKKFSQTKKETDYQAFKRSMSIPLGDHKARVELLKTPHNIDTIRKGFLQGHIHKYDVDGIIALYERFHTTYYLNKACMIWAQGDSLLALFLPVAQDIHKEINLSNPSSSKIDRDVEKIEMLNHELTILEDDFSSTLGEGSRWMEDLILKLLFFIALTVEVSGLILTIYISRGITKGLHEINKVAKEVAVGNFGSRAKVYANDEIGHVATALNRMSEKLSTTTDSLVLNEQRLELVLESTQLGIWEMDVVDYSMWRNPKHDEIFGYSSLQQKWTRGTFLAHVYEEDKERVYESFKHAFEKGGYNMECRIRRADNMIRWISIEGHAYRDATGKILKMAGIVMDITKRKTVEEKLKQSNKELEQFAFVASHDLQEPLRSISNFTELLQKQSHEWEDENAHQALGYIFRASDRMKTLVRDLLEYSRIGNDFNMVEIDCNALVAEILNDLSPLIQETGAKIQMGQLPVIQGFKKELKLLFKNLICNALYYRKKETNPEINILAEKKIKEWLFKVEDNGIGIETKYFERIFVIFQKLHSKNEYPGTGIGLALCKKTVELHGGKIWVESILTRGSSFCFTIPLITDK